MKVLMVCSGGMSSSIVVKAIKQEADKKDFSLEIKAVGTSDFDEELREGGYDLAIVAPQVKHRFSTFEEIAKMANVPIEMVTPMGYTPIGASKVLDQIRKYSK
ncbi:PTS sugar transporter subunit IIB [Clostridium algidicarnis]|uniref:PTS sugar transporter subunit IIB n=1 Tax=Clostridium algidicarnis TaxID=37659 RepID=UPI000495BCE6|nr:PTS sugar transporter subunit IIB [Clostridium algidicarnis]MBU3209317.1 PTS sugar transporter subunit IIB [Clostridium algidicarnis]